jgi:transposase InsO family protein
VEVLQCRSLTYLAVTCSGWPESAGMSGRIALEWVAGIDWNARPESIGISGRNAPESAHIGAYEKGVALGLGLRHDWGPQYTAHQFQGELKWLGIRSTPSYVGEPECNGVAERFMRTLKERCLYLHDFESLEEAREAIAGFVERYNRGWLLERYGHKTPAQVRQELTQRAA